jgi:glutathione S-transferase
MRLYISTGSPFVRKCRVVVQEKGLTDRVEEVALAFPYKEGDDFLAANPIGQVPALVDDDGQAMTDSPMICAYLDSIGDGPRLLPPEGPEHWRVRRMETLADSILEMAVKYALEGRRPEAERSATWMGWWTDGLNRALDQAEAAVPDPEPLDLGKIALAIAGHYVDFRRPELGWRASRPKLAAFADGLDQRPSFAATRPF